MGKGEESGGRWRKFSASKFWMDYQVLIHWMGKEEESGVGGENLMLMEVGGIVRELFSYLL